MPFSPLQIRAYDNRSSFDLLGQMVTERAKDIVEQRDPISHEHPDRERSRPVRRALKEVALRKSARL